jgi:anti-sigma B factor antagonist
MEVVTNQTDEYDVIQVSGRVDSFTAPKLADVYQNLMKEGRYKLIFDMTSIDYISSAGLRVMIDVQKNCRLSNKGELVLVGVPKRISETLELAGFLPLFRIFGSVDAARNGLMNS